MPLSDLTKKELIALAKEKDLDSKGTKNELIARLESIDSEESSPVKEEEKVVAKKAKIDMELPLRDFINAAYNLVHKRDATSFEMSHYEYHLGSMNTLTREEMIEELKQ